MKTKQGHNWYIQDLDCYSTDFLIEIIEDLYKKIKELE